MDVLLINPYIYDFSAYNFWSAPLGLLYVGSILRKNGLQVTLLDCMRSNEQKRKPDGRAPYIKQKVDNPNFLKGVKKHLKRYGISREEFIETLTQIPQPHLILVTCIMTYWYLGVKEVITILKEVFPNSKIVLGGIYVSLCLEHAKRHFQGVDLLVPHNRLDLFYKFLEETFSLRLSFTPSPLNVDMFPYPSFDLYSSVPFIPLITSYGCPFRCGFCATPYLYPKALKRSVENVINEISHWSTYGVKRFILYDDAFLHKKETHAKPLLRKISELPFKIEIYNPNALNAVMIDQETAYLLKQAGFEEVRIGFEGLAPEMHKFIDGKVNRIHFENAISFLKQAGFDDNSLTAYLLVGLPFQRWQHVKASIDYLKDLSVRINIAEYTPIPHTEIFESFHMLARYPIAQEPFFQNNSLFPFSWEGFTEEDLNFIKQYARA